MDATYSQVVLPPIHILFESRSALDVLSQNVCVTDCRRDGANCNLQYATLVCQRPIYENDVTTLM